MGLLICMFLFCLLIGWISYMLMPAEDGKEARLAASVLGFLIPAAISSIAVICILGASWSSYARLRAYNDGVIMQYSDAIEMYADHAVLDMNKVVALTDFKYQGYQDNMGQFIIDFRSALTEYNYKLGKKKVYDDNWFFGWLIIGPDKDMKVVRMKGSATKK